MNRASSPTDVLKKSGWTGTHLIPRMPIKVVDRHVDRTLRMDRDSPDIYDSYFGMFRQVGGQTINSSQGDIYIYIYIYIHTCIY
jgi:hypothetical protein